MEEVTWKTDKGCHKMERFSKNREAEGSVNKAHLEAHALSKPQRH